MKRNFNLLVSVVVIVVVISGVVIYNQQIKGKSGPQKETKEGQTGLEIGNTAPDFKLANLSGKQISLSDFRGKYVMVNFWATWCPPCQAEMPDLNQFHQENKDNFVVVGVNIGESRTKVKEFMTKNGYDYPILLDQNRNIASMYRISAIPTSYFIDPSGKIQYVKRGLMFKETLDQIKEKLMNQLEISLGK